MRWHTHQKIVAAGLLVGAVGGFLIYGAMSDPTSLGGASPAFAEAADPAAKAAGAAVAGPALGVESAYALDVESDPTDRLAHFEREPYHYASLGRRDPFASLVSGDFISDGEVGLVDIGSIKLVGIAWDEIDRFAMVEDARGFGHALREGDPVRGGKVLRIDRESVTFAQSIAGVTNTITIELPIQEGD
jgi:hypothetical protein